MSRARTRKQKARKATWSSDQRDTYRKIKAGKLPRWIFGMKMPNGRMESRLFLKRGTWTAKGPDGKAHTFRLRWIPQIPTMAFMYQGRR